MMPFRAAMPSTVRKPTSEPSEITPPAPNAASTPPTSANGSVRNANMAKRQLRNDSCSSNRIATSASPVNNKMRSRAAFSSRYSPCNTARYPIGKSILSSRLCTSFATDSRSRFATLACTSMRREPPSRLMMFGLGLMAMSATLPSRTRSPVGVSISMRSSEVTLWRHSGEVHTCTS